MWFLKSSNIYTSHRYSLLAQICLALHQLMEISVSLNVHQLVSNFVRFSNISSRGLSEVSSTSHRLADRPAPSLVLHLLLRGTADGIVHPLSHCVFDNIVQPPPVLCPIFKPSKQHFNKSQYCCLCFKHYTSARNKVCVWQVIPGKLAQ